MSSYISNVLSLKISVSQKIAARIADRLQMDNHERTHFTALARADAETKERQKIRKSNSFVELPQSVLEVIQDWHHSALFALLESDNVKHDAAWMGEQLGLTREVVEECLERLVEVGLVEKNKKRFEVTNKDITTSANIPSAVVRTLLAQQLQHAMHSLKTVPMQYRDMSAYTLAFDFSKMNDARKMIEGFRRKFAKKFSHGKLDCVFNLNIQFVPVTQTEFLGN